MKVIQRAMFDNNIRTEVVLHLGTMCLHDAFPDAAKEAFEDDADEVREALAWPGKLPEDFDAEEIADLLRRAKKQGFLVKFATPAPVDFTETGHSFSWGYYSTKWIYAEDFEEACRGALAWAEKYVADRRAAALAKGTAKKRRK